MPEKKAEEKKVCVQCGWPGGRRRVDPYRLEIYGERVVVRLHDRCVVARVEDI